MDDLTPTRGQHETSRTVWAALEAEKSELVGRIENIETQLRERRDALSRFHLECIEAGPEGKQRYFAEAAEFKEWRSRAVRARRHVVARLSEIKIQIRELNSNQSGDEVYRRYIDLRRAVQAHQAATLTGDYEPTPHDLLLWEAAYLDQNPDPRPILNAALGG